MRKQQVWMAWGLLGLYAILGYRYSFTFRNEVTAWENAVQVAQLKLRPRANYALALMERRRFDDAWQQLDELAVLVEQPHLLPLDADEGRATLLAHRVLLSRADARDGR